MGPFATMEGMTVEILHDVFGLMCFVEGESISQPWGEMQLQCHSANGDGCFTGTRQLPENMCWYAGSPKQNPWDFTPCPIETCDGEPYSMESGVAPCATQKWMSGGYELPLPSPPPPPPYVPPQACSCQHVIAPANSTHPVGLSPINVTNGERCIADPSALQNKLYGMYQPEGDLDYYVNVDGVQCVMESSPTTFCYEANQQTCLSNSKTAEENLCWSSWNPEAKFPCPTEYCPNPNGMGNRLCESQRWMREGGYLT